MTRRSSSAKRPLLSDDRLRTITADDLARIKLYPDEIARLRAISEDRERARMSRVARLGEEERPLVADLAKVGIRVRSVWDLVNTSRPYPDAIPVLLAHLLLPYSDRNVEGIARALAVGHPLVREAWPILVRRYEEAPTGSGRVAPGDEESLRFSAKDGLACTPAVAATERRVPEVIRLVRDPVMGSSRILLLKVLKRHAKAVAELSDVLEDLSRDSDLAKEVRHLFPEIGPAAGPG